MEKDDDKAGSEKGKVRREGEKKDKKFIFLSSFNELETS